MFKRLFFRRGARRPGEGPGDYAGRLFDQGLNCAQTVLQATTGIDDPKWLAVAKAFGGGIGGSKCVCGAVAGGIIALGAEGRGDRAGELVAGFRARNRVTCCIALSRPFRWLSREHRANCRRLTCETADEVDRLLRR